MTQSQPLISVVTPVYNGEAYLVECIESVLAQTYSNWEFILVNNCSKDRTPEIIRSYCEKDPRIKMFSTEKLIPAIENHNYALSKISPDSRYCKILQGDDLLFPECLQRMADVAVNNPGAGIIGSYSLFGDQVKCDGIHFPDTIFSGREIARLTLLGKTYPFLSPSTMMVRSDLIRSRAEFYDVKYLHGDITPMYELLKETDFGFVHQVLSYIRVHEDSATSTLATPLNTIIWSNLYLFVQYGPVYLNDKEFKSRLRWHLEKYYQFLSDCCFEMRDSKFWHYHIKGLADTGYPLSYRKLLLGAIVTLICRPRASARKLYHALKSK